jgi:hypothetical protein
MKMSQYHDRYEGRPAAILGGGPSLPVDLEKLPKNSLLIAVNYHAFHFCKPRFMVYNDTPDSDPLLEEAVRTVNAIKVSPEPSSDIKFDVPVWTGFYSSNTAAWFALWMGCNPVILCGMDCYQGEVKYCHPWDWDRPSFHYSLDFHIRPWIEECRSFCPHPERLCAMSGPLVQVFGAYHEMAAALP